MGHFFTNNFCASFPFNFPNIHFANTSVHLFALSNYEKKGKKVFTQKRRNISTWSQKTFEIKLTQRLCDHSNESATLKDEEIGIKNAYFETLKREISIIIPVIHL